VTVPVAMRASVLGQVNRL